MERELNELVKRLEKAYGDRLVSVLLYGSAASGNHHKGFSDLNTLCVLKQITPRELRDSTDTFHWWRKQGNPAPLLLTIDEVGHSSDCFPIEFHDIKDNHRLLFGEDVVRDLEIERSFYRAQVEHDLRAKLLRLRQKAAGVLADRDQLATMLADSLSTFCVLFRHALLLQGQEAAASKREVIEQSHNFFGVDSGPFLTLLGLREKSIKVRDMDPVALLESYLHEIQTVIDSVDRLEK